MSISHVFYLIAILVANEKSRSLERRVAALENRLT